MDHIYSVVGYQLLIPESYGCYIKERSTGNAYSVCILGDVLSVRYVFSDELGFEVEEPEIRERMIDITKMYLQLKSCCE